MQVSIIIVTYNTKQLTLNCLNSIKEFTKNLNYEIILVDNASTDGSKDVFKCLDFIKYIYSDKNLGFGRANNLGASFASGEYIFMLNSDTLLIENSIKKLHDFYILHKNKNIGILGCILCDGDFRQATSSSSFPTVNKYLANIYHLFTNKIIKKKSAASINIEYKELTDVDMVSGADMFMKRVLFNSIGGFDERYFLYFEDTDLQFRIKKLGYKNIVSNVTKIIHLEGGSLKFNNFKRIVIQESQNIYFKSNDSNARYLYVPFQIFYTVCIFFKSQYTFKENIAFAKNNLKTLL